MKILYLLIFVSVIYTCTAIKCWVCRSDADPKCGDPFDNSSLPIYDCSIESLEGYRGLRASMCRKIRQKAYGEWRYIRSCAFLGQPGEGTGDENNCLMRSGTYDIYAEYCTCNSKDGCNTASGYSATLMLITLSLGLTFWLVVKM